jgi:small conductance mechanosensitive channel
LAVDGWRTDEDKGAMQEDIQKLMTWKDTLIDFFIRYGFQILGAIIILTVGVLIARWLGKVVERGLKKQPIEPPVRTLIVRLVKLLVIALALILVLDKVGVQITPLIAGIGVAGAGIALALQGVMGNLAAGLQIMFTKPFRIGEYIELFGVEGEVHAIELFYTTLQHHDGTRVRIPNRKIIGEILLNDGKMRQLDLKVGVSYASNVEQVLLVVREVVRANPRCLKEPEPIIGICNLADSAITIQVRPWVSVTDYVVAPMEIYQAIVKRFRESGIEMPFPQREVRILNDWAGPTAK